MLVNIYNKKLTTTEVAIVALFPLVAFHFYQYRYSPDIGKDVLSCNVLTCFSFYLKGTFQKDNFHIP